MPAPQSNLVRSERGAPELSVGEDSPEDNLERLGRVTRELVREVILPCEAGLDPEVVHLPEEVLARARGRARRDGIWMIRTPERFGGSGLSLLEQCIVREEAGKCRSGLTLPAAGAIGWDPPHIVWRIGTPEQVERFTIPAVERGEFTFVGVSEPAGGGDPARAIQTRAVRSGTDWVLNGRKVWIGWADKARWGIVFARTGAEGDRKGISCFIIETDRPGVTIEPIPMIGPMWPTSIRFNDYRIPAENLLGQEGDGFAAMQEWVVTNRVPYSAGLLGAASVALDIAVHYARERVTFGGVLADKQAIQWMLADSEIELRAARELVHAAARRADQGLEFKTAASVAKVYTTETAGRVIDRAVQVLGARGLMRAVPLERWYREIRIKRIGEGPSEVHRLVVARHLLHERGKDIPAAWLEPLSLETL